MRRIGIAILALLGLNALAQERTTIEFWHSMGGALGEATEALVKDFNAAQNKVTIKSQFVGSYDDGVNKLLAALRAGQGFPHVIQVYDIGSQVLSDSGRAVTLQELAERDGFDVGRFVGGPKNYYTIGGKLNSLPFNSSNPLLYINGKLLDEAGISYRPTWTLNDLEGAARKLTVKDASGKTTRYGLTIPIDSWFVEQFTYNSGEFFCNNENGRKARASEVSFDNPAAVAFLDWWARLVRDGVMANTGRTGADSQALFAKGDAVIGFYSTASLAGLTRQVGGRFPLRTAFYPYLKERNGVAIGGASLWVLKGKPEAETEAAWAFVKYLLEPKTQGKWHLTTGYFPVVGGVLERSDVRQAHVKNPNFTTAIRQLETSKVNTVSAGCLMGQFTEIRQYVAAAIEETIKGKAAKQALSEAKQKADAALQRYNASIR
jgi:sn-glycerol 3-phosphate transport system substrate-binding protein